MLKRRLRAYWAISILMLSGCSSIQNPFTMNVMPTLTPEGIAAKSDDCVKLNGIPEPYPPNRAQIVLCKTKSVLPPGYVSPVPYVRVI